MQTVRATFEDGVLKPRQPLDLPPQAEVRLTIELLPAPLTIKELNAFLQGLPGLGDDREDFAEVIRAVRAEFPPEVTSWD